MSLRRALTPAMLLVLVVGDMVGGGIYALVGRSATQSVPTWVPVVGVIVCIGLLTQREADVWLRAVALLVLGLALWGAQPARDPARGARGPRRRGRLSSLSTAPAPSAARGPAPEASR